MHEYAEVAVLRLGHRPGRDERTTTHVGLTARALGADRLILEDVAEGRRGTVEDITDRFGGPFEVTVTDGPLGQIRAWDGAIAHLTMYGEPVQAVGEEIQARHRQEPLLVVVGAEKVPFEVYEHADWNVGVTNQPHSEIAALAVFLDRLFDGAELDRDFENATQRVVPQETGKRVVDGDDADAAED
ncbi:tRNA (cytidine(56)-2'-O)-methyltransferase [Halorhabdus sp. CBA1104]|uniref:tRNA (cytidine(56)-2'-O)-methyltransferase n=1 Tax=unclassified Halorhabdus TaxID=2621901 RepID=UPI0012B2CA80|nr:MULTISPECIES: tRNA (cytidine(56)-2'-O)-methyltransferase [unclassified Halorhabdus]QGN06841.1 tRNA (cytidine(56)-2'-O)-methyltransferase [Halorhabdus sp. CBA1104]